MHARTLGKLRWGQRIPNRAEILELMLGSPKPFPQLGQVILADSDF